MIGFIHLFQIIVESFHGLAWTRRLSVQLFSNLWGQTQQVGLVGGTMFCRSYSYNIDVGYFDISQFPNLLFTVPNFDYIPSEPISIIYIFLDSSVVKQMIILVESDGVVIHYKYSLCFQVWLAISVFVQPNFTCLSKMADDMAIRVGTWQA